MNHSCFVSSLSIIEPFIPFYERDIFLISIIIFHLSLLQAKHTDNVYIVTTLVHTKPLLIKQTWFEEIKKEYFLECSIYNHVFVYTLLHAEDPFIQQMSYNYWPKIWKGCWNKLLLPAFLLTLPCQNHENFLNHVT